MDRSRIARIAAFISTAAFVVLAVAALLEVPANLWLTKDQQAQRLEHQEQFADAAALYTDPLRQGVAYYRNGDFEDAAAAFSRLDEPESAYNRGNALVLMGQYDEAIASYDRAIQLRSGWKEAEDNRAVAVARRDRMKPPEDGAKGTELGADEIVFDDQAKNAPQSDEVEVGAGEQMSDEELRALWLQRVQTNPADFLRSKFAYQLAKSESTGEVPDQTPDSRKK